MLLVAKAWWHFARKPGQGRRWLLRLPGLLPWRLAVGRGWAGMAASAERWGRAATRAGRPRLAHTALSLC